MQTSSSIGALIAALAKAQSEIKNPALDKLHPHFKGFRYASLGSHIDAIRESFSRHGLVISQGINSEDVRVSVTTMIAHASGEWLSSTVGMTLAEKATAQNLGATVTYLRRYALASMCLLTGDDDTDAEEDRVAKQPQQRAVVRDVFDSTPVATSKATYDKPKSAKATTEKSKWPTSGTDVVKPVKVVNRDGGMWAVLCSHATAGNAWVCVNQALIRGVSEGDNIELTWHTNDAGVIVASEIAEPMQFRDAKGNPEIPFFK
jgi:hypothetical protein